MRRHVSSFFKINDVTAFVLNPSDTGKRELETWRHGSHRAKFTGLTGSKLVLTHRYRTTIFFTAALMMLVPFSHTHIRTIHTFCKMQATQ